MRIIATFLISCLMMIAPPLATAQLDLTDNGFGEQQPKFLTEQAAYQLTGSVDNGTLTLVWQQAPTYYLYKDKYKLRINDIDVTDNAQFDAGKTIFDPFFEEQKTVYYDTNAIVVTIGERKGKALLELDYQGCTDKGLCYPPSTRYLDINFDNNTLIEVPAPTTINGDNSQTNLPQISLVTAFIFALLGGVILNLMPCVFPVLSLKALSLSQGGDHRGQSIAYTLGAITFFVGLAATVLTLREAGQAIGWGFQLQQPIFIGALALIFTLIIGWLTGLIEVGAKLQGAGQSLTEQGGLKGSFATGALAAVVASPCTAPFMASALAFAITQPTAIALAIFAALGLGMALPILLLSYVPTLSKRLPKPGLWMITFRQAMVFPMALTIVWLVWVFNNQTSSIATAGLMTLLVGLAFAQFLWVKNARIVAGAVGIACFAALIPISSITKTTTDNFQSSDIDNELAAGKGVFLNVTADWCITCIANERAVLSGDRFEQLLADNNATYIKADWTTPSPDVDQLLARFNRVGVPLYVYFASPTAEPIILPQILTDNAIKAAIEQQKTAK